MFICVGETIWTAKENSRKQKKKTLTRPQVGVLPLEFKSKKRCRILKC